MNLEICVDSVESAIAAATGGAKRIELCSALSEGGITPSTGLISAVRSAVKIDVFVIIRPRGGDFVYSDPELDVMHKDILEAKARKVDGVVLGILTEAGAVDITRMRQLIEIARPLQVTFHRAFDLARDMDRALEDVIACGADRILTSGGKPDAMRGATKIAQLLQKAGGRIGIMAGGGIRASNVRTVALMTGVREVHTSLSKDVESKPSDGGAEFGARLNSHKSFRVLEHDVRAFKSALDAIAVEAKPGARLQ
ncbi:MAG TPA: copper homeostasis protein CutC [Terracidiphilus sp.]|nr:copper homeostasis protein CutC [Terracidiphilus sp.]